MPHATELLIVGAGPFGLAMAAYAEDHGLPYTIAGVPMQFWRSHMPPGMLLRSGDDWHLDPAAEYTIERFFQTHGIRPADVDPLPLAVYLEYVDWFCEQRQIEALQTQIRHLDVADDGGFLATLEDGATVAAKRVLLALGMGYFAYLPLELVERLPASRFAHTRDVIDLAALRGQRCLIVGGRQSAFEWAALLREAGAGEVFVSYRHATPTFTASDWSWVEPLISGMVAEPGWFRSLTPEQQADIRQRMWAEGRLKLEPWLAPRLNHPAIHMLPATNVRRCSEQTDGTLLVELDSAETITVDTVILATGYRVNLEQVPLLAEGNLLARLETRNGYPALNERFESSVPGLFFTSFAAGQDFGPFFGFTVAVRAAATIIGRAIAEQMGHADAASGETAEDEGEKSGSRVKVESAFDPLDDR